MARVALVNLSSLSIPGNDPIFPLGIERIRQVLDEVGHSVRIVDFRREPQRQHDHSWIRQGWDVVGITIRNVDPIDIACESHVPHYRDYVANLRAAAGAAADSILWVGGGSGFSLFAQELTDILGLDVGVVGPGESAMMRLCRDPRRFADQQRVIMTGTPDPEFSRRVMEYDPELMATYAGARSAMIGVETRRKSCYQGCTYCPYAHITNDDAGAERDIPALLREIQAICDHGMNRIFFTDAIFNADIRYAKNVVAALNAHLDRPDLRWSAYFTP